MDIKNNKVTLYTAQRPIVMETLDKEGIYYVKKEYIKMKYQEVSKVFLEAYNWFVIKAKGLVEKPQEAEYPIWTFTNPAFVDAHQGDYLLTLKVPIEYIVFFSAEDWNKVLNFKYIPRDKLDKLEYEKKLQKYNIHDESQIYMTSFYPHLKPELKKSWDRLFIYDKSIVLNKLDKEVFQASLWEIRKDWIANIAKL